VIGPPLTVLSIYTCNRNFTSVPMFAVFRKLTTVDTRHPTVTVNALFLFPSSRSTSKRNLCLHSSLETSVVDLKLAEQRAEWSRYVSAFSSRNLTKIKKIEPSKIQPDSAVCARHRATSLQML